MKKFIFWGIAIFLFLACEQVPSLKTSEKEVLPVSFQIQFTPEVIPFPGSRSMPTPFPDEPEAEKPLTTENFTYDHIYYTIYNTDTEDIYMENQISKGDEDTDDFGDYLYESLPIGNYQITVIAHSSIETTSEKDIFIMTDLHDLFAGIATFTILPAEEQKNIQVNLYRKVSRIEFSATDDIPDEVKAFCMEIPERYCNLNLLTGEAETIKTEYSYQYVFKEEDKEIDKKKIHSFYTLVPTQEQIKLPKVILSVKNAEGETLRQREVLNIPIYQNRVTRYTGFLYSSGMTDGTFDLNFANEGKWDEEDVHTIP